MTVADLARLLLDLEHPFMAVHTDRAYQQACAELADRLDAHPDLWARLQRAAVTCHHCIEPIETANTRP